MNASAGPSVHRAHPQAHVDISEAYNNVLSRKYVFGNVKNLARKHGEPSLLCQMTIVESSGPRFPASAWWLKLGTSYLELRPVFTEIQSLWRHTCKSLLCRGNWRPMRSLTSTGCHDMCQDLCSSLHDTKVSSS